MRNFDNILPYDEISRLLSSANLDNIKGIEDVLRYFKEDMIKKMILEQHNDMIKQLPPKEVKRGNTTVTKAGRYYVRLNGEKIYKTKREDIEKILLDYFMQEATERCTLTTVYHEWKLSREDDVSENTMAKDEHLWKKYFQHSYIAQIPLSELDRPTLKKWATQIVKNEPYEPLKKKYFYNISSVMNGILDYAADKGYVAVNTYRGIKINQRHFAKPDAKAEQCDVFTADEEYRVIEAAKADSLGTGSAIPLGLCLLFDTGIRDGELCALKYGDIQNSELTIQRMMVVKQKKMQDGTLKFDGYRVVEHPKSVAGFRRIPLTAQAMMWIDQIKELNEKAGFDTSSDAYIFMRTKDKQANVRAFDARLRKYCRQAGMDVIKSPHDIRRTFITKLGKNVELEEIQYLAGHESMEMTFKYMKHRKTASELRKQMELALTI